MLQEVHGVPKLVNDRFASWFPEHEVGVNYGQTPATGGVATLIRKSNDIEKIEHMQFATGRVLRTTVYVKGSLHTNEHCHVLWNIHDEELNQSDLHAVHDAINADIAGAQKAPELCTVVLGGDLNAMPPDESRVLGDSAAIMRCRCFLQLPSLQLSGENGNLSLESFSLSVLNGILTTHHPCIPLSLIHI